MKPDDLLAGLIRDVTVPSRRSVFERGTAVLAARLGALGPPPKRPASEARLTGRLHTRRRDIAAIAHHYDLSNEFYELLLDEHMAYLSAFFSHDDESLHDAQTAKLDMTRFRRQSHRRAGPLRPCRGAQARLPN